MKPPMPPHLAFVSGIAALLLGTTTALADVLVSDIDTASVFLVNSTTGNRTTFSGAGVGSGVDFQNPEGIAVQTNSQVLVVDTGLAAVVQVDPTTGNRTVFSGGATGSGQAFVTPFGAAIASNGSVYVSDAGDQAGDGFIVKIDPATGNRTLISGLGVGSGDAFSEIRGIATTGGNVYVTDVANQAVYQIDPTTGARTIIYDATHGTGPALGAPLGITVDSQGNLLVADAGDQEVIKINPQTGVGSVVSGGGTGAGTAFALPSGVTVDSGGQIQVADSGDSSVPALPAVFNVSPLTGDRSVLSDDNHGTGPSFQNLDIGIAQDTPPTVVGVPEPSSLVLAGLAVACALGYRCCRRVS